jgi:hypothetical protein
VVVAEAWTNGVGSVLVLLWRVGKILKKMLPLLLLLLLVKVLLLLPEILLLLLLLLNLAVVCKRMLKLFLLLGSHCELIWLTGLWMTQLLLWSMLLLLQMRVVVVVLVVVRNCWTS